MSVKSQLSYASAQSETDKVLDDLKNRAKADLSEKQIEFLKKIIRVVENERKAAFWYMKDCSMLLNQRIIDLEKELDEGNVIKKVKKEFETKQQREKDRLYFPFP